MTIEQLAKANIIDKSIKENKEFLNRKLGEKVQFLFPEHLQIRLYTLIKDTVLEDTKKLEEELNKL